MHAHSRIQVEAIKSGVQPGLTMVVGPPGTGKTDTAVQIMHVLYHNCPGQRTLLITHSNQALNDLFEKILERDVPARCAALHENSFQRLNQSICRFVLLSSWQIVDRRYCHRNALCYAATCTLFL